LRNALGQSGFTAETVEAVVSEDLLDSYSDGWFGPARRRMEEAGALGTLTLLFALGLETSTQALDGVPGADLADWEKTGLVALKRGRARPLVSIRPLRMWGSERYLVGDPPHGGPGVTPFRDFVPVATPSAALLAKLTPRRRVGRCLDMGTGAGIQAILAARRSESVVATDVNARALAFARFNLGWNDVDNVELRQGDRYGPVEGEAFDLIVSNPPRVIAPNVIAAFRDSSLPGDTLSETAIVGAADHLGPDGWAVVTCQWARHDDERWQDRVQDWVSGTNCDTWAIQQRGVDAVAHTREWLADVGKIDPKEADRRFDQWMASFDEQGIVGVGTGIVVLHRRSSGTPWFSADEIGLDPTDSAGDAIVGVFAVKDWLREHARAGSVLDTRWRTAQHLCFETTSEVSGIRWASSRCVLRQRDGLRFSMPVTEDLANLVARCDGTRTLRAILDEQLRPGGRESSRYADPVESSFRKLADRGFIAPVLDRRSEAPQVLQNTP
jgi:methylase of polypeptide subunit release factors